ncbi:elongation factor P hydroxylase [Glaciecola sp. KUL10]|jgi:elongation factor P hydroxylase|uniref:elongation factor P hydroxylase n=1 Tax=Glaciecola sp. (strain KUL10) TaxID=2161813 RepID=UPI000D787B7F|nr:elongation factor P hydroxylase [Glaciecola sp. KUL10]GBL03426.1 hypothetical protein KUL10_07140 [Glaciecola sp. KUL10]
MQSRDVVEKFNHLDLQRIFNNCFAVEFRTCLQGFADEPLYIPEKNGQLAEIHYSHDYFASALHEIAHWCIAGPRRRTLEDYGYWYSPDGRNKEQQLAFQKVEVKPQALELAFSSACGKPFRVSADNLNGSYQDTQAFEQQVQQQYATDLKNGFTKRASVFLIALHHFYQTPYLNTQLAAIAGDLQSWGRNTKTHSKSTVIAKKQVQFV